MPLDDAALDLLFREARTHNKWTDQPVTDDELRAVFDLLKMGADLGQLLAGAVPVPAHARRPRKSCGRRCRRAMSTRPWRRR